MFRRPRGLGWVCASLCGATLLLAAPLAAQTIPIDVGDTAYTAVAPGAKVRAPLMVDLSQAGGAVLGALQGDVTWRVGTLKLDSIRAVPGFTLTANTTNLAAGLVSFNTFGATGLTASGPVARLFFTAGTTAGPTTITFTPRVAGNLLGQSLLSLIQSDPLRFCVSATTFSNVAPRYGDANASGGVNITDAQQIARYAVDLSVTNALAILQRGDVNADGAVDVLDALLVARFSTGLDGGALVNKTFTIPSDVAPVATVSTAPAAWTLLVGQTQRVRAIPRAADGTSLEGCYPVTWATSKSTVATVSTAGVVTAKALGTATISATVQGIKANTEVTVASTLPTTSLAVTTAPAGATSSVFFGTQPVVTVRDSVGNPLTGVVTPVTAQVTSGAGTLSGTTTVNTVNGVATFTTLAITGTGAHTLSFTAPTMTGTSAALSVATPSTMRLLVGAAPSASGKANTNLAIPLVVDLSGRGTENVAALTLTVSWDPAKFTFVSWASGTWTDSSGGGAAITPNTGNAAAGQLSVSGYTMEATLASFTLGTLTLKPLTATTEAVSASVSVAGNAAGSAVTVLPRNLSVTSVP